MAETIFDCIKRGIEESNTKRFENDEFLSVYNKLEQSKESFFITGRAGTGKSTLLRYFSEHTKKKIVVLAPTGLAALNVSGQTIHSFFRFPPRVIESHHVKKMENTKLYKELDAIVIDEASMVRSDMLDGIDKFMRRNGRDSTKPFGGCQVLLFGDLYQLSPVVTNNETSLGNRYLNPYFFNANVYNKVKFETIELEKVYRQSDTEFIRLLDAIRTGEYGEEILNAINSRVDPSFKIDENESYITLTGTNERANMINSRKLASLQGTIGRYKASFEGNFDQSKSLPADAELYLKKGARVIITRNDPEGCYVNGSLGLVHGLNEKEILVKLDEGSTVSVKRCNWEKIEYKLDAEKNKVTTEVKGVMKQFPIRLAWALTIHKGQGQTFNRVYIDLSSGAFSHGQTYVALSRSRTLNGIVLKSPIKKSDVIIDSAVTEFLTRKTLDNY